MFKVKLISAFLSLVLSLGCSPLAKRESIQNRSGNLQESLDCPMEFSKLHFCAQAAPTQLPLVVGKPMQYKIAFWEKERGSALGPYRDPGLTVNAWLWMVMPAGSHGSAPIKVSSSKDSQFTLVPGIFDLEPVIFSMPCRNNDEWWELHIDLKAEDDSIIDHSFQKIRFH